MAIYYLSLFDQTRNADLKVVLNNYDSTYNYGFVKKDINRYLYLDRLFDKMGPYMLQTLLVYDFLNYKIYGLSNKDVMYAFYNKSDNENNVFYLMEHDFRYSYNVNEEYFRSH